jgi:hypothetical protein
MATLLKVLNNLADIKSAGGVALRVRTQAVGSNPLSSTRWSAQIDVISYGTGYKLFVPLHQPL